MEDLPPNMPSGAYGVYELEGLCIWVNEEAQANIVLKNTGVISHEYTHYMQSISTFHALDDLLTLLFFVHAGIQRLEDCQGTVQLPLRKWASDIDCPSFVKGFVKGLADRAAWIRESLGQDIDFSPPPHVESGLVYERDSGYFIRLSDTVGVPVQRLALMEGAAAVKKCEALGNLEDIQNKKLNGLWHYVAAYEACRSANERLNPLETTKCLTDVALCSPHPGRVFFQGIQHLRDLGNTGDVYSLEKRLGDLYDAECREYIERQGIKLLHAFEALPPSHKVPEEKSWCAVVLKKALNAIAKRQAAPLSLIKPIYLGKELYALATQIGSPVVITNDMRLTSLCSPESLQVLQAKNAVRTLTCLCQWIIEDAGSSLPCPYAGCPGCPEERRGRNCKDDARKVIDLPDEVPWCTLYYSAKELRIVDIIRANLAAAFKI